MTAAFLFHRQPCRGRTANSQLWPKAAGWLLQNRFILESPRFSSKRPTTYASLRGGGFKRLVRVHRTASHTQEPFTLPFVPKMSVRTIFYPIRWLTPTDIHLLLSLRFEVRKMLKRRAQNGEHIVTVQLFEMAELAERHGFIRHQFELLVANAVVHQPRRRPKA